eukprot:g79392.t1
MSSSVIFAGPTETAMSTVPQNMAKVFERLSKAVKWKNYPQEFIWPEMKNLCGKEISLSSPQLRKGADTYPNKRQRLDYEQKGEGDVQLSPSRCLKPPLLHQIETLRPHKSASCDRRLQAKKVSTTCRKKLDFCSSSSFFQEPFTCSQPDAIEIVPQLHLPTEIDTKELSDMESCFPVDGKPGQQRNFTLFVTDISFIWFIKNYHNVLLLHKNHNFSTYCPNQSQYKYEM